MGGRLDGLELEGEILEMEEREAEGDPEASLAVDRSRGDMFANMHTQHVEMVYNDLSQSEVVRALCSKIMMVAEVGEFTAENISARENAEEAVKDAVAKGHSMMEERYFDR